MGRVDLVPFNWMMLLKSISGVAFVWLVFRAKSRRTPMTYQLQVDVLDVVFTLQRWGAAPSLHGQGIASVLDSRNQCKCHEE